GRVAVEGERERRHAALHLRQAVQAAALRQPGEKALAQRALLRGNRVVADRPDVVDRGDEAGEELVRQRPGFEAVSERLVRGGANLVRPPALEELRAGERKPEVGPEELVRRRSAHDGP